MKEEYIYYLISFLSAIFAVFITQMFTYSRDTRNLILQKYDQSLSSLDSRIAMFIDYTVAIEAALQHNPKDMPKRITKKLLDFGIEHRDRDREEINFSIITSYDFSMEVLVDQYKEKEDQLFKTVNEVLSKLAASGKASSEDLNKHREEYIDISAMVQGELMIRIEETMKHPFYKYIIGIPKFPKE